MTWIQERMLSVMFTFPWLRLIHHHVDGHLSKSQSASQSIYLPICRLFVWIDLCAGHVGGASEPFFDTICCSSRINQNGLRALMIDHSDSQKGTEQRDK